MQDFTTEQKFGIGLLLTLLVITIYATKYLYDLTEFHKIATLGTLKTKAPINNNAAINTASWNKGIAVDTIIKPVRVFQIGFSRCGTGSIADFFNRHHIPAVHHDFGRLATSIMQNHQKQQPLLIKAYDQYLVFTDMERMYAYPPINVAMVLFKELDQQYPGSKFILNTRNKKKWLKSRANFPCNFNDPTTLLEKNAMMLRLNNKQVLALWSKQWDDHHKVVLEYFKDRPNDLLVFDIEKDDPQKLVDFFKDNYKLNADLYGHINKGIPKTIAKE